MPQAGTEVSRITVGEVRQRLDRGEPLLFLDTRNPKAWAEADVKLPGALRVEADKVDERLTEIPRGRSIVTYCT